MSANTPPLIMSATVHDYFRDQLCTSLHRQKVDVDESTQAYLINLLGAFMDPRQLFVDTPDGLELRPLAFHYADAVNAPTIERRNLALKKLGDVALFISGLFAGSLNRKLVDIDYYIAMGGMAYRDLHDLLRMRFDAPDYGPLFGELAEKFARLVDVLAEVSDASNLGSHHDVLRLYEVWLRTGSEHARRRLHRLGIVPSTNVTSRTQH